MNKHTDGGMESRMTAGVRSKDRRSRSVVAQRWGKGGFPRTMRHV